MQGVMRLIGDNREIFRRLVMQGNFGRANKSMRSLASYMDSDFDNVMEEVFTEVDELRNVEFRSLVPANFRPMFRNAEILAVRRFFREVVRRRSEFSDKRENYRAMICFYGIYLAFVVRLVEIYGRTVAVMVVDGKIESSDADGLSAEKIGLTRRAFNFYADILVLRERTIDDWLNMKISPEEEAYIISAARRVLFVLGF